MWRLGKLGLEYLDRRKGEEDTASDQRASIQISNLSDDFSDDLSDDLSDELADELSDELADELADDLSDELADDLTKVAKPGNLFITF
jgi:hypothetical protein